MNEMFSSLHIGFRFLHIYFLLKMCISGITSETATLIAPVVMVLPKFIIL